MASILLRNAVGMAAEMTEAFAATVAAVAPVVLLVAVVEVGGHERLRRERAQRMAEAWVQGVEERPDWDETDRRIARLRSVLTWVELYPWLARLAARRMGVKAGWSPAGLDNWVRLASLFLWTAVMGAQAVAMVVALSALRDPGAMHPLADDVCMLCVVLGVAWVAMWPLIRVVAADGRAVLRVLGERDRRSNPVTRKVQEEIDRLEAERQ
ncbi:hypothetical protein [Streptomyces sp. NPDC020607]|uniref:hypothetical protein n=1 Tax=Streptomyces sp. NPDC020607 TaxID=3365082 RepID=UPI00378A508F